MANSDMTLITRGGEQLALDGVTVSGDLHGLLFEATIEQRFHNPMERNAEVIYTFPLPWGAVLLGVDVQLGEKHLSGAVVAKDVAEARYEEALSDGDSAIMLERAHDGSYSMSLGNLASQEYCVIRLRYAHTLHFEQGALRLMLPATIAPRYGDQVAQGGMLPHQTVQHSLLVSYPLDIQLRIHGDLARARVASPSHPIALTPSSAQSQGAMTIALAREGALDRDFVLVLDHLPNRSQTLWATDPVATQAVTALASFCPQLHLAGEAESSPVAMKILVDCSGSMQGDSMEAARKALRAVLANLQEGHRFSLSRFGNDVTHESRSLWRAGAVTRSAAIRWVDGLQANMGGTAMESALQSTFALAPGGSTDVLLVTDGQISAIDSTVARARASGHRLFIVGIGASPAESHLRRLAEATGGACDFVVAGEAVEPAVRRMFVRLGSPRMIDLALAWPGSLSPIWMSALPAGVFDGDTLNVHASLPGVPQGEVRLLGRRAPQAELETIACARFEEQALHGDGLPRMTMSARYEELALDNPAAARDVALAYQLVTSQTHFLLVHARAADEKFDDMPALHKVAHMLPAGWAGVGAIPLSASVGAACERQFDASFQASYAPSLEILPAFLRRSSPEPATYMTPLALCEWARSTSSENWPATLDALSGMGVDDCVIDWLRDEISPSSSEPISEATVVEVFLQIMSQREMHTLLRATRGPLWKGWMALHSLFASRDAQVTNLLGSVGARIAGPMMRDLEGTTADQWSPHIRSAHERMANAHPAPSSDAAAATFR